jgi:hypothetical protein
MMTLFLYKHIKLYVQYFSFLFDFIVIIEVSLSKQVTRSTHKRGMLLQGPLVNDADGNRLKKRKSYPQLLNYPVIVQRASRGNDLEVVRQMLIKVRS